MKGRVKNNRPAEVPGVSRKTDVSSVLPEVVYDLLFVLDDFLGVDQPSPHRVTVRDLRAKLARAYPEKFGFSETDLAQQLAEEDGDAIED